jgi:DoxX-like family
MGDRSALFAFRDDEEEALATKVGRVVWIGRVISWLATALFLVSAFMKVKGGDEVQQGMAHLGISADLMKPLAMLELACVALYLIPPTAVLGAILLTGYLGGAICTHLRVGDPYYAQIVLGVAIWLSLWLRDARLKALLPLRTRAQ